MPKQTEFQVINPVGGVLAVDVVAGGGSVTHDTPGGNQYDITPFEIQIAIADLNRVQLSVLNIGADPVYVGATGITNLNAPIELAAGAAYSFDAMQGDLFAICAAGDASRVAVYEGT